MQVLKRNSITEGYNSFKIMDAMERALIEVGTLYNKKDLVALTNTIEKRIKKTKLDPIPIETIQDIVESELLRIYPEAGRAYLLYRIDHKKKWESWDLTDLQRDIYESKYRNGRETFFEFLERVGEGDRKIQKMMRDKKFLPAGRILAGRGLHKEGKKLCLSNCFVITPPRDNLESIFEVAKKMARTYSYGGGCGLTLENLRPRGAEVNNAARETTGAVSFMDLYSTTTGLIGQAARRGALMLSMPVTHPDIEEFIDVKTDLTKVTKANISVMITDDFMRAVEADADWETTFTVEDTGEVITKRYKAKELMMKLALNNWRTAEPGMLFWDRVQSYHLNDSNPDFRYSSTNPCGEKPLVEGGSCLLGSLNLAAYVDKEKKTFNKEDFWNDVQTAIWYLDDVLEGGIDLLPLEEQREAATSYRNLGLGIMGFADALIYLGIEYGDESSIEFINMVGKEMANAALQASSIRAKEKGVYPKYNKATILDSNYLNEVATEETIEMIKQHGLRNAELLSIAPTGSISTMIGISGGLEPIYQFSYNRRTQSLNKDEEVTYKVFTPIVKEYMDAHGLKSLKELPNYFVSSANLHYEDRIAVQAAWQKWIDSAISSTVNVPENFTVENTFNLYMEAWKSGLKGVTIFRDNCERLGILTTDDDEEKEEKAICPICEGKMMHSGGCEECVDCGYSPCAV